MGCGLSISEDLLARAGRGDQAAWRELYERCRNPLNRLIDRRLDRRLVSRVSQSDIFQETMTEAWRRFGVYLAERPMPFPKWLYRLASDQIAHQYRRHVSTRKRSLAVTFPLNWPSGSGRESDPGSIELLDSFPSSAPDPQLVAERREQKERLYKALNRLSRTERSVIMLRCIEGRSSKAVAAQLKVSETAVRLRQMRAIRKLRNLLRTP